jgi:hypothetical protein
MRIERPYQTQRTNAATSPAVRDINLARIVFGSALLILFLLSMAIATPGHDPEYGAVASAEGYGVSQ